MPISRGSIRRGGASDFSAGTVARCEPVRSLLQDAPPVVAHPLGADAIAERYPERAHEERAGGGLVSFFTPDAAHNRHVVLRDKERMVARRHGTILRTGQGMLLDETTLCATCWMHGVFAAQLTIGNTSFHKLFSVARDPYNITRSSGLRILIEAGGGWRLLAVPSAFELGLSDCRWIYRLDERTVTVRALASGDDPALQWRSRSRASPAGCWCSATSSSASASSTTPAGSRSTRPTGASPSAPTLRRCGASATRTPSTIWSPARPAPSRRSAATSCSTPMAGRGAAPMWRCGRARRTSCASRSWAR